MYKDIDYYGAKIKIFSNGKIYNNGKLRTHRINADGYPVVTVLCKHGYRSVAVHRLMAMAFVHNDDPQIKTEVNHKDFNRKNWSIKNLEWVSHKENVQYSVNAGHYVGKFGEDNPNYNCHTLHIKYMQSPELSKEKQSRSRGVNGRSKQCVVTNGNDTFGFKCQRDAVDFLIENYNIPKYSYEHIIKRLKEPNGYFGWLLKQV